MHIVCRSLVRLFETLLPQGRDRLNQRNGQYMLPDLHRYLGIWSHKVSLLWLFAAVTLKQPI
jgi:uncharacterized iron-regulated membrane protein